MQRGRVEPFAAGAAGAQRFGTRVQFASSVRTVRDVENPVEMQARVRFAFLAQALDELRIHRQRLRAQIEHRRVVQPFRVRRQHARAGPRRRARGLAAVEHFHHRAAPREIPGDG